MMAVGCSEVLGLDPTTSGDTVDPSCGNATLDATEDCDDGNTTDDGNGCDARCKKNAVCGDNKVHALFEACDDGNKSDDTCSDDCKLITVEKTADQYGAAFDLNKDGVADAFQDILSGQQTVTWDPPLGIRTAFEVDVRGLPTTPLLKAVYFRFAACCVTNERPFNVHGYAGNGSIDFADFANTGSLGGFAADNTALASVEVTSFVATLLNNKAPFAGFLLRADTATTLSLSVYTPFSGLPDKYPRLVSVYCLDANSNGVCD